VCVLPGSFFPFSKCKNSTIGLTRASHFQPFKARKMCVHAGLGSRCLYKLGGQTHYTVNDKVYDNFPVLIKPCVHHVHVHVNTHTQIHTHTHTHIHTGKPTYICIVLANSVLMSSLWLPSFFPQCGWASWPMNDCLSSFT